MARKTSETSKSGCLTAIGYSVLVIVLISVLSYLWDVFKSLPRVVIWSVVIGLIAVIILVVVLKIKKKKKTLEEKQAVEATAEQAAKITAEQLPMPKATIRVVSSHDDNDDTGMYKYEYDHIGVYRPENLDLPLPPIGARLEFENDPTNEYDDKAIKAVWNGQTVGWLYRKGKREMIRDWIDRGNYYVAEVTENDPELKFWIGMDK